ncbi:unnamed protein product [Ambrosiozyma monospora]|uniref:Unnamed protein product n=1 Tax=Ambrosiozyma monospora TaxID=43982 RepID=A0ACB5T5Y7_AMBMO|nr:unnamed protein product [Ambrosiozyma monospora]
MVDINENDIKEALQPEASADGNRIRFVQPSLQLPNTPANSQPTLKAEKPTVVSPEKLLAQSPDSKSPTIENAEVKKEVETDGAQPSVETAPPEKPEQEDAPAVEEPNIEQDTEDTNDNAKPYTATDDMPRKKRKHEEVKQEEIRTSKRGRTIKAPQKYETPLPEVSTRRGAMRGRVGRPPKNKTPEPEKPKRKYTRRVNVQKETEDEDAGNEVDDFDIDAAMTKAGFEDSEDKSATRARVRKEVAEFFSTCEEKDGAFECVVCSKVFTKRGNLKRHLVGHCDTRLFSCLCGRSFIRSDNLKHHQSTCRVRTKLLDGAKKTVKEKKTDGKRRAPGRPKGSKNRPTGAPKKVYKRKPITERNFHCRDCGKAFKRKYHLKRHLLIHENEQTKPFVCITCGLGFKRPDLLENHTAKKNCYRGAGTEYSDSDGQSTGDSDSDDDSESESEEE